MPMSTKRRKNICHITIWITYLLFISVKCESLNRIENAPDKNFGADESNPANFRRSTENERNNELENASQMSIILDPKLSSESYTEETLPYFQYSELSQAINPYQNLFPDLIKYQKNIDKDKKTWNDHSVMHFGKRYSNSFAVPELYKKELRNTHSFIPFGKRYNHMHSTLHFGKRDVVWKNDNLNENQNVQTQYDTSHPKEKSSKSVHNPFNLKQEDINDEHKTKLNTSSGTSEKNNSKSNKSLNRQKRSVSDGPKINQQTIQSKTNILRPNKLMPDPKKTIVPDGDKINMQKRDIHERSDFPNSENLQLKKTENDPNSSPSLNILKRSGQSHNFIPFGKKDNEELLLEHLNEDFTPFDKEDSGINSNFNIDDLYNEQDDNPFFPIANNLGSVQFSKILGNDSNGFNPYFSSEDRIPFNEDLDYINPSEKVSEELSLSRPLEKRHTNYANWHFLYKNPNNFYAFIPLNRKSENTHSFMPFGKRLDNSHSFIPFGKRPDNAHAFIPFGKKSHNSHSFIPFGKKDDNSHSFIPFGKKADNAHSFIPFGKKADNSHSFIPFGKRDVNAHSFIPFGKKADNSHSFIPFGKKADNTHSFIPFGKKADNSHSFIPFGKKADNSHYFMPFGKRPDNSHAFIPFGKKSDNAHSFIPFGKRANNAHSFIPFGKRADSIHSFMPFGKRADSVHSFMPFGKRTDNVHSFMPFGKRAVDTHSFIPFGKKADNTHSFIPFGKKADNVHSFIPFGKKTDNVHSFIPFGKKAENVHSFIPFGKKADRAHSFMPFGKRQELHSFIPFGKKRSLLKSKEIVPDYLESDEDLYDPEEQSKNLLYFTPLDNFDKNFELPDTIEKLIEVDLPSNPSTTLTPSESKSHEYMTQEKKLEHHTNELLSKQFSNSYVPDYEENDGDIMNSSTFNGDLNFNNEPFRDDVMDHKFLTKQENLSLEVPDIEPKISRLKRHLNLENFENKRYWGMPFQGPRSMLYPHAWLAAHIQRSSLPLQHQTEMPRLRAKMAEKKKVPMNSFMHFG